MTESKEEGAERKTKTERFSLLLKLPDVDRHDSDSLQRKESQTEETKRKRKNRGG